MFLIFSFNKETNPKLKRGKRVLLSNLEGVSGLQNSRLRLSLRIQILLFRTWRQKTRTRNKHRRWRGKRCCRWGHQRSRWPCRWPCRWHCLDRRTRHLRNGTSISSSRRPGRGRRRHRRDSRHVLHGREVSNELLDKSVV